MASDELPTIDEVTRLEEPYVAGGEPVLSPARAALAQRWRAGERDKETSLRLAFLDWFSCAEPDFLTGLPSICGTVRDQESLFEATVDHLLATAAQDAEVALALGWMLTTAPWCTDSWPEHLAEERGAELLVAHRAAGRLDPAVFSGRGAYGSYFQSIDPR